MREEIQRNTQKKVSPDCPPQKNQPTKQKTNNTKTTTQQQQTMGNRH